RDPAAPGRALVLRGAQEHLAGDQHDGDVPDAARTARDRHLGDGGAGRADPGRQIERVRERVTAIRADHHVRGGATPHDGEDRPAAVDPDLAGRVRHRGGARQVAADLDRVRGLERLDVTVRVAAIAIDGVAVVAGLAERELDEAIATRVDV